MNTELYNQLIKQAKRGDRSLTGLFNASDCFYAKASEYPAKEMFEYVEACEEAGAETYRQAIQTPPRTAAEAYMLFIKITEYLRPELDDVKEISPNVYQGVENLKEWLAGTMRLYMAFEKLLDRE